MNTNKTQLFNIGFDEFAQWLKSKSQAKYRANQVYQLAIKGYEFDDMQTLPKALRQMLSENFIAQAAPIYDVYKSQIDETEKFLYKLSDGNIIEGVLMKYHYGYTLCISTQVGCKMGCTFCASTLNGCERNLTAAEMFGQVISANKHIGDKGNVGHIVLMGSGEALDNYDNTIAFLKLVHNENLLNIGYRNISISTCGLVPAIYRFMEEDIPATLSISLHAPNDEIRMQTMPIAKVYLMDSLMDAARAYVKKTGRRVIFEYAAIDGVNCSGQHAIELADRLKNLQCHVNLIPLNKVEERQLNPPSNNNINAFMDKLKSLGVSVTKRRSMGNDIEGACGQLRNKKLLLEKEK
ncbi:MAG: 23S rRNA (adenine(2503)-C(2))-methyltransferase RlmN [Christensenellaceae bacterium]|nr:23S rRNA (adenine(2503)-C(2))-methyltransferase RlmN [Christensenellaceae bacterium]